MDIDFSFSLLDLIGGVGFLAWGIRASESSLKEIVENHANPVRWLANALLVIALVGALLGAFRYGSGLDVFHGLLSFWGAIQIGLLAFAIGVNKRAK